MNKSGALQLTLNKPSSKELTKIKEKLRENQLKTKQHESLCFQIDEGKHSYSIIPHHDKERKVSKKELKTQNSPAKLIRSKSKKLQQNGKKLSQEKHHKKNIEELYSELMSVKSEYKTLKQSYNKLVVQKIELTERQQTEKVSITAQLENSQKQIEKYQKIVRNYEQQIERIKKECYKLVENEKLRIKKLEETIQQKDLMIAFLRSEAQKGKKGNDSTGLASSINQSSIIFLPNNPITFAYDFSKNSMIHSVMSNVVVEQNNEIPRDRRMEGKYQEDSLSFSRDKSKQMDSFHSFLTNHDQTINNATKKDIVIVETHSSFPENESQCLTFQNRGEESGESIQAFKNQCKTKKNPFGNQKGKNLHSLPPKNMIRQKAYEHQKKTHLDTDQNSCVDSNKNQVTDLKKSSNSIHSSRQRKKQTSKKKKV